MRTKMFLTIVLVSILAMSFAYAAGTPAGTAITNFATGEYSDANGNALPNVTSNTVTTIVSQVAGVDISPETSSSNVILASTVAFPLTLTNTGNGSDTFDLTKVSVETGGGVNTATIYHDANGNGVLDGGETEVTETSELTADATYDIIIMVENTSGDDGSYCTTTLTATSQFDSDVSDDAVVTSTVSASVLEVTLVADIRDPEPGDIVTYTITGENSGSATAKDIVITSPIPSNVTYYPGSMTIMGDAQTDADDSDSSDFNVTTPGAVTFNWGDAAGGATGELAFQVQVNDGVPVATVIPATTTINYNNAEDVPQPSISASATNATLTVAQVYAVEVGADQSTNGDPGDIVYYTTTITNNGNGPDIFSISYTSALTSWEFYLDNNADGIIESNDDLLEDTNLDGKIDVGTMVQNEVIHLIVKAQIPAGTSDQTQSKLVVTATSVGNTSISDNGELTVTVTAPSLSLSKAVLPLGNQPPGTTLTYTITVTNSGSGIATSVVVTDVVPQYTTYETGSMQIGGSSKTDASDGDGATFSGNSVTFEIPQIGPGGTATVSFETTID